MAVVISADTLVTTIPVIVAALVHAIYRESGFKHRARNIMTEFAKLEKLIQEDRIKTAEIRGTQIGRIDTLEKSLEDLRVLIMKHLINGKGGTTL